MITSRDPSSGAGEQHDRKHNLASSDPYEVLGLGRNASAREIKRAYFALVREYPPEGQPESFKLLRAAYEKLRSAEVKAETDLFLFQRPEPWEPRKRRRKLSLDIHSEDLTLILCQYGDLGRSDFTDDFRKPKA